MSSLGEQRMLEAGYRLGPKRNCGMAGLFQACDRSGTPLTDVYLLKLQRAWLREAAHVEAMKRELSRLAALRAKHLIVAEELVELEEQHYLLLRARRAVTLEKLLSRARRAGRRLPPAVISRIFLDVALGLAVLHRQLARRAAATRCFHGALSGTTIWVHEDGSSALLDCGSSRALPSEVRRFTSGVFGELGCRPPEALRGGALTPSSDVYSLSVLLCEALSGRRLFLRDSLEATWSAIINAQWSDQVWSRQLGLGRSFVNKALSVNPEQRYASATAFADALRRQIPPASRRELSDWVNLSERPSSWPVVEGEARDAWDDEEMTYLDSAELTQEMNVEEALAPLSGADVPEDVAECLARSVPPQLLRRLAEQDALERLAQLRAASDEVEHAGSAPKGRPSASEAMSSEVASTEAMSTEAMSTEAMSTEAMSTEAMSTEAMSTEAMSTERDPRRSGPRFDQILIGVAVGVLACVAWESYRSIPWGGALVGLGSSSAAATVNRRAPERPEQNARPESPSSARVPTEPPNEASESTRTGVAREAVPSLAASSRPRRAPQLLAAAPAASHRRAESSSSARSEPSEVDGEATASAEQAVGGGRSASPARGDGLESPPVILVPTRLHPRLNPLMTTRQVYPESR